MRWPTPCLVALILILRTWPALGADPAPTSEANVHRRGRFQNARIQFEREKTGNVAFIGGSITEMNGYRPMMMEVLENRFPQTEFTFTDAGIASTCSTTGAFRLQDHVLVNKPDLLFIEFAVNDDQDAGHAVRECVRGMEGLIRHARTDNPNIDIVITFFVNPGMLSLWRQGKAPVSAVGHTKVAERYLIPTIGLGKELADQIQAQKFSWKLFGGVHPKPPGNQLCAAMIDQLMTRCWSEPLTDADKLEPHPLPKTPIDPNSYFRGRLVDPAQAKLSGTMKVAIPDWESLAGGQRSRFKECKLLCIERAGEEATLAFEGTGVGVYVLAGPDAAVVESRVDGGEWKSLDLSHHFSRNLHYPRTVMFEADLKPGQHELTLRISDTNAPEKAARILCFVVN